MSDRAALLARHLIDTADLDTQQIFQLFETAERIRDLGPAALELARGRILATLFWEPSTRTRLSFETAMLRLGGQVIGFSDAQSSSASKGETLADTIRIISLYADLIAMRHPGEGAALAASRYTSIPIINAGDGAHLHPTQTLGDLYTIHSEKGGFRDLVVCFQGDLRYGRTVHTLARALARFGTRLWFAAPQGLELPDYVRDDLHAAGASIREFAAIDPADIAQIDVLYATRLQKERFQNEADYLRFSDWSVVDRHFLARAKQDLLILHPLPRNQEIALEVDSTPNAGYFRQAACGMRIRQALIATLLGLFGQAPGLLSPPERLQDRGETPFFEASREASPETAPRCTNPKCISVREPYLSPSFRRADLANRLQCQYCEHYL